jgi:hypothetical protein
MIRAGQLIKIEVLDHIITTTYSPKSVTPSRVTIFFEQNAKQEILWKRLANIPAAERRQNARHLSVAGPQSIAEVCTTSGAKKRRRSRGADCITTGTPGLIWVPQQTDGQPKGPFQPRVKPGVPGKPDPLAPRRCPKDHAVTAPGALSPA